MDHNNVNDINQEKVDIAIGPSVSASNLKKMKGETLDTPNMIILKNEKKDPNDNGRASNKNLNGMLTSSESDTYKSLPFKLSRTSIGRSTELKRTKPPDQMEANQLNNINEI